MLYRTILEQKVDKWEDGYGVIQIVTQESTGENQRRFCYYKNGEFVNRPLTLTPSDEVAARHTDTNNTAETLPCDLLVEKAKSGETFY